ncbi:hypothetical protein BCU17_04915 [Vibrio splendidus]|uniref:Uncharacterized protein n=1 Tax=Vibrio splendidus TaxID=29497 RepID=A0A2N7F7R9_VIBSP|nr:hypothetical protein BCU17_04915 [Vibrio splendidus]
MSKIRDIQYLYLSISILFVTIVTYDYFFGEEFLKQSLPLPEELLIFNVFFILPHILCSYFVFFSGSNDHLKKMKKNIVNIFLYFSLYITLLYYDFSLFVFIYLLHGTYHLVMQQVGLCKVNGFIFHLLKLSALSLGFSIVLKCYFNYHTPYLSNLLLVFMLILLFYFRNDLFIFSNVFLLASMCILFIFDYSILSLFLIRVAHDSTAFYFYSIHESNRQGLSLKKTFLKIYFISVIINLSLFYLFGEIEFSLFNLSINLFIFVSSFLAIGHYALESSIWRRGSPNRRFIY